VHYNLTCKALKKAILLILFLTASICVEAQHYDVKLFDGRIKQSAKQAGDRAQEYRRIQKEYTKYTKQRKKQYHSMKDSLGHVDSLKNVVSTDSIKRLLKAREEHFVYTDSLYSLRQISTWDKSELQAKNQSISKAREKLEGREYMSRYEGLKSQISSHRKTLRVYRDSLSAIDSLDRDEINFRVKQRKEELSREYEGKLEAISREVVNDKAPELPGGFRNKELEKFQKAHANLKGSLDKGGLASLSRAQSIDHFKEKHEILKRATGEVAELKKKFSEVTDSRDLSSAIRNSSLKGDPIKKRMVYGGTFQLHVDNEMKIDLNPELGYKLSKRLEIGFGGTYRLMVRTSDLPQGFANPTAIGLRGFVEHKLIKHFYVHGEYESLTSSMYKNGERGEGVWHNSLFAGIERRFVMNGKFQGQVLVLYNFNGHENPLYSSPWVFRVGFNVSENNR